MKCYYYNTHLLKSLGVQYMKLNNIYLMLGIVLSICSKILQFRFKSLWGDILILPSAVLFVLSILLYIPKYREFLYNPITSKDAKVFALLCCLAVLSFQLLTMIAFGRRFKCGFIFILPFIIFSSLSIFYWMTLLKSL